MNGKTIVIATHDKRGARRVSACLRGAGNRTLCVDDARGIAALVAARVADLVILDCVDVGAAEAILSLLSGSVPIVAVSPTGDAQALARIFCDFDVDHLVAGSRDNEDGLAGIESAQIVTVVEKLLRGDHFGLEKYMPGFGVELHGCAIRRAEERDELVELVAGYLDDLGCSRRLAARISTLADELVTNAIYNAPCDSLGRHLYSATDRRNKVRLDVGEEIQVCFGSDGEKFAISVTDPFGSLSPSRVRACIRRCLAEEEQIEQKSGGAGLGLFTAFMSCSQLVFNVDAGRRTEVIAIVEIGHRARAHAGQSHSIHVFSPPSDEAADGVPATVILSDSVRVDLGAMFSAEARCHAIPKNRRRRRHPTASTWGAPVARRRKASGSNHPHLIRR